MGGGRREESGGREEPSALEVGVPLLMGMLRGQRAASWARGRSVFLCATTRALGSLSKNQTYLKHLLVVLVTVSLLVWGTSL